MKKGHHPQNVSNGPGAKRSLRFSNGRTSRDPRGTREEPRTDPAGCPRSLCRFLRIDRVEHEARSARPEAEGTDRRRRVGDHPMRTMPRASPPGRPRGRGRAAGDHRGRVGRRQFWRGPLVRLRLLGPHRVPRGRGRVRKKGGKITSTKLE